MEKVHAVVARSTIRGQNAQNTPGFEHLVAVEMFKQRKALWREAHVEVKMCKTRHAWSTFGS